MHGLVEAAHVDHLHPDSGIAIATAADGPALTKEIFGDRVLWVPWRRPGFQLGLDIAAVQRADPQAIGVILGGHGITAWGATSAECEARSREIIETAAAAPPRRKTPPCTAWWPRRTSTTCTPTPASRWPRRRTASS
jgi:rhamnose utilization protein RhaD (predicted bifunctional aldolase and dehydrogenase)